MTIIDGAASGGGEHCETTALGVLLRHAGVRLSEPMLFGLGAGLSFIVWDSKRQALPFLGGRVRPFELTRSLAHRLGLHLEVHETSSARKAWEHVRGLIDRGFPVGLQLDSHDLDYFGSRVHFAGHVVAMIGYDDTHAHLVDTAQQGGSVTTSLESLARARAARGPMSARHRSFTVDVPNSFAGDVRQALMPAIAACAEAFLAPPIANAGCRGIRTAARRLPSWFDRVDDPGSDLPMIATMMERAGTGGALFRNLYRDFLAESLELLADTEAAESISRGREGFAESARLWTATAELIEQAGTQRDPSRLDEASRALQRIAALETDAMRTLRSLSAEPTNRTR